MSQLIQNLNTQTKSVTITRTRSSKKDKARELYLKYHELSREQITQKLIEELDMPDNSARTYVSICAKELNDSLGKAYKTRHVNKVNQKRERAFQIFADNPTLPRKEMIEKLKNELGMTYNSAATHCSLASKAYKNNSSN